MYTAIAPTTYNTLHTTESYVSTDRFSFIKMNKNLILLLITIGCSFGSSLGTTVEENPQSINATDGLKKLSRRKRYLAFPEGSSFSVCVVIIRLIEHYPQLIVPVY